MWLQGLRGQLQVRYNYYKNNNSLLWDIIVSPQRSKVILPVKILHLLVSDLRSYLEVATASEGTETDDDDDDGYKVREMEALLRSEEGQMEQEDIEDDPDINNDPILQLDIQVLL